MPRMSKKRKEEWAFFLNDRRRIAYNALCRKKEVMHHLLQNQHPAAAFRAVASVYPSGRILN